MQDIKKLPFIGIVSKKGYTESYDYYKAKENDFHHSFCLSGEGLKYYDSDETLRFVLNGPHNGYENLHIALEGNPALDPFKSGKKQIKQMCELYLSFGADENISLKVEDHCLGTRYENEIIGSLKSV